MPERVLGDTHMATYLVSHTRIFTILLWTLWLILSQRPEKNVLLPFFLTCLCNCWHRTSSLLGNIRVSRAGQFPYLKPEQRWSEGHQECGRECSCNYKRKPEEPLFMSDPRPQVEAGISYVLQEAVLRSRYIDTKSHFLDGLWKLHAQYRRPLASGLLNSWEDPHEAKALN